MRVVHSMDGRVSVYLLITFPTGEGYSQVLPASTSNSAQTHILSEYNMGTPTQSG